MDDERSEDAELWQLIDTLTEAVKTGTADIEGLIGRADESDVRADAADARADRAEARADRAEARADRAEILAALGSARLDKVEAAELGDRQMIAELQAAGELSRQHAEQMEQALRSSRVIGAAIGLIMASRGLTEDQAFAVLSTTSRESDRKLREVADVLVHETGMTSSE